MNGDLFQRAFEAADIEAVAGVPLFRAGRHMRGECPMCGASKGKKSGGAFSVEPRAKVFKCFACGEGGDVVALEHLLRGRSGEGLRDAAARLAGDAFIPVQGFAPGPRPVRPRRVDHSVEDAASQAWKAAMASSLWREARPARGTLVETYLRVRGITGRVLDAALDLLRFHPTAYHSGPRDRPRLCAAIVGLVLAIGPAGTAMATGGVHVTYLASDGRSKAALEPGKRMFGPQGWARADGVTRPGGVWLTRPDASGPLIVAEGIESALSAGVLADEPVRIVATLSLGALQGGWVSDRWGRYDPDAPAADPDKPAFTWPEPEAAPWGEVRICVDRDMSEIRVKARKAGGGTWKRPMDSEGRAKVCAGLAEQAWRRQLGEAGAHAVRIWAPGPGRDFNDELMARIACGEVGA